MASHGECTEAHLGSATTKQLIDELAARAELALAVGERWPAHTFACLTDEEQKVKTHYVSLLEEVNGQSTCSCPEGPMVEWIRKPQYEHQPRCKRCLCLLVVESNI